MAERDLYPSEKQDRFIVRLPDGMRDRIKAVAEANNRSMNAEIVATLEEAYPPPKPREYDPELTQALLDEMDRVIAKYSVAKTSEEILAISREFQEVRSRFKDALGPEYAALREPTNLDD